MAKIDFERNILLKSKTLPSVMAVENVNPVLYDALVMDTQGSELLIFKGAISLIKNFRFVKLKFRILKHMKDVANLLK